MRKLLIVTCAIAVLTLSLTGCATGKSVEVKAVSLSAQEPALDNTAPAQAINRICEVSNLDAEQAAKSWDALARRLGEYNIKAADADIEYEAETAIPNGTAYRAFVKNAGKRFQVVVAEESAVVNEIDQSGNILDRPTQRHNGSLREDLSPKTPEDNADLGDQRGDLHSTQTPFNVRNSLNLELDDVAGIVGDEVAAKIFDDLNDNLSLWGKTIDKKTDVQVSKDVSRDGDTVTFDILAYVELDDAVFRVTYNTKTLESTYVHMP